MEAKKAVEELRIKHCLRNQNCTDSCQYGENICPYDMAIVALEKQIAKKVNIPPCNACENELCDCECVHFGKEFIDNFRCPTCYSGKVYVEEYGIMYDYCPKCGQKLDWKLDWSEV